MAKNYGSNFTECNTATYNTADELYEALLTELTSHYGEYVNTLVQNGNFAFFKSQPRFVRFMMFSQEYCYYSSFKNSFCRWVINGDAASYDGNYGLRSAMQVKNATVNRAQTFKDGNVISNILNNLALLREDLLNANPILTDDSIPYKFRYGILSAALRNDDAQICIKLFYEEMEKIAKKMMHEMFDDAEKRTGVC